MARNDAGVNCLSSLSEINSLIVLIVPDEPIRNSQAPVVATSYIYLNAPEECALVWTSLCLVDKFGRPLVYPGPM